MPFDMDSGVYRESACGSIVADQRGVLVEKPLLCIASCYSGGNKHVHSHREAPFCRSAGKPRRCEVELSTSPCWPFPWLPVDASEGHAAFEVERFA